MLLVSSNASRYNHKLHIQDFNPIQSRNINKVYDKNLISGSQFFTNSTVKLFKFKKNLLPSVYGDDVLKIFPRYNAPVNDDSFWSDHSKHLLTDLYKVTGLTDMEVLLICDVPESCQDRVVPFLKNELEGVNKFSVMDLDYKNEKRITANIKIDRIDDSALHTVIYVALNENLKVVVPEIFQGTTRAIIFGYYSVECTQTFKGLASTPHSVSYGIGESNIKIQAITKKKYGVVISEDEANRIFMTQEYKFGKIDLQKEIEQVFTNDFQYVMDDIKKFYKDKADITIISGAIVNNNLIRSIIHKMQPKTTRVIFPKNCQYSEVTGGLYLLRRLIAQQVIKV